MVAHVPHAHPRFRPARAPARNPVRPAAGGQVQMRRQRPANCRLRTRLRRVTLRSAFCLLTSAFACLCFAQSNFNTRGLGEVSPSGEASTVALGDPFALSTLNPGALV